ncbi:MAG: hypothetical protein ACD_26C00031G0005 [uncultured bacterium]|nr:MAG: hypothetical protein ACD_26C00031G0005 [uncultured bacterium]
MKKVILLIVIIILIITVYNLDFFINNGFFSKTVNDVYYSCTNGKKMRVIYYEESVKVIYENKKYILYQAPMASGIKYINKYGYELFSKGNKTVFNLGIECFEKK